MDDRTVADVLAEAADLVERSGIHCVNSALGVVLGGDLQRAADGCRSPLFWPCMRAVARELGFDDGRMVGPCLGPRALLALWEWNDAPGRTQIERATAMRNAKRFA